MQRLVLCASLIFVVAAANASELVWVPLDPIPDSIIEARLAEVTAPQRTVDLESSAKTRRTSIIGPLSEAEALQLLIAAEHQRARWLGKGPETEDWSTEIVSDGAYAIVRYFYICGQRCGRGADFMFGRDDNKWKYLGKTNDWIS